MMESCKQLLESDLEDGYSDHRLPCVLRRFRKANTGYLGQARVRYGDAQDCDFPKALVHGVVEYDKTSGAKLIEPPPKTWLQQLDTDLNESIYATNRFYPVGSSHNQLNNLPPHIHPDDTSFGIKSNTDIKAEDLINPKKDRFFVQAEHDCCRQLYRKTHLSFDPGQQVCRNYVGKFKRTDTFGDLTPHDRQGRPTGLIISSWRSCDPDPPYVSKVYADHLDQRIPKLGMPQDRLCGYRDRGPNFVYGTRIHAKDPPVAEVIFNRCPNPGAEKSTAIMHNIKEWLTKMRQNFKSDKGADLESLYEDFYGNDKDCNGTIEWEPFMKCLIQNRVPRTMEPAEFMEALAYINIFHPLPCNKVDYYMLMDFIKGHQDATFACNVTTLKPYYPPHANSCILHRTTYSELCSNMCTDRTCIQYSKENRINGMPSIRKDKLPTLVKGLSDMTNYGDDGDAYSLIWPSVYTTRGVTIRDAFRELTREQMNKILCKAKISVTHADVDCAWAEAEKMDPEGKGRVCYQSFREALEKLQKEQLDAEGLTYETELTDCPSDKGCRPQPCTPTNPRRKRNPCTGVDP